MFSYRNIRALGDTLSKKDIVPHVCIREFNKGYKIVGVLFTFNGV